MAGQYSPTQFFRRVPNALLGRFFQEKHGVLKEIAFNKLKETDIDPIFHGFSALPDDRQAEIEAECRDIDAMACQGGMTALTDESAFHQDLTFPDALSRIDGFHGAAMWTLLEYPAYWAGATLFLHSDNISESSWKKRNDLPHLPPHVEPDDTESLAKAISHYFHTKEGRGRNCKVEVFRRHSKEYFHAYPEDYAQSGMEWKRNELSIRARHPVFEIIFVYCEAEGSLDIYAPKNTKAIPDLQKIFAKTILKLDTLADGTIDKRVYDLNPLADPNFEFRFPLGSGISNAIVTKIRLTLKHGSMRRILLEADAKHNAVAVYDLLKEIKPPPYYISQISIKVVFEAKPGKRAGTKTFNITHPNSCNLNHVGRDNIIRTMLAASNIEPRAMKDANGR